MKKANEYYKSSGEKGNARALHNLALAYEGGKDGIEKDYEKAKYYMETSANLGYSIAQYTIGGKYDDGDSFLPKDPKKAYEFYKLGFQIAFFLFLKI